MCDVIMLTYHVLTLLKLYTLSAIIIVENCLEHLQETHLYIYLEVLLTAASSELQDCLVRYTFSLLSLFLHLFCLSAVVINHL